MHVFNQDDYILIIKILKEQGWLFRYILVWNKSGVTANFAMPLHAAALQWTLLWSFWDFPVNVKLWCLLFPLVVQSVWEGHLVLTTFPWGNNPVPPTAGGAQCSQNFLLLICFRFCRILIQNPAFIVLWMNIKTWKWLMAELWLCFVQELLSGRVKEIGGFLQHTEVWKMLGELGASLVMVIKKQISIWHICHLKWRVLAACSHS